MEDPSEQRYYPRYYNVKDDFPGELLSADDRSKIPGKVMDVSRDGVGFLADERVVPGSQVILRIASKEVTFRVVYCTADLIYKDRYRLGLNLSGRRENLVSLFNAHGCLEDVSF